MAILFRMTKELESRIDSYLDTVSEGMIVFSAGVNAYISGRSHSKLGLEFALLKIQGVDFEVEEWTGPDSLIWGYMMMFNQANQLNVEVITEDQFLKRIKS